MENLNNIILNRLLSTFNLEWTGFCLKYKHKLKYGSTDFYVCNDISKVYSFIGIVSFNDPIDIEYITLIISNNKHYNKDEFLNYASDNSQFEVLKNNLKNTIDLYQRPVSLNAQLKLIDSYFKSNIRNRLKLLYKVGYKPTKIKSKFNGKLVMNWTKLKQGKILADTINEFKIHIKNEFNIDFTDYLLSHVARKIRQDFDKFYNHFDYLFGIKTDLPF